MVHFCVADYFPWARWVDVLSGYDRKIEKIFTCLDEHLDKIINERIADRTAQEELGEDKEDFVDLLLRLEKSSSITRDHVKANILVNYPFQMSKYAYN